MLFAEITAIIDEEPHGAALNMALDEALLEMVADPVIRVYRWKSPSVTIGYFGRLAEASEKWPTREIARRWTGGGIVLHGEDITFSLIVPAGHPFAKERPAETYRAIHECVAQWLRSAGMAAGLAGELPKVSNECFASPVQHDVMAGDQKVSGGAQRRSKGGMLHQGSIQPISRAVFEQRATLPEVFGRTVIRRELKAEELAAAEVLVAGKYGAREWLQRW